jgi:hypothetical protein
MPLIWRAGRTTTIGSDAEVWSALKDGATIVATAGTSRRTGYNGVKHLSEVTNDRVR